MATTIVKCRRVRANHRGCAARALLAAAVSICLAGCMASQPPSPLLDLRPRLGAVALVPAPSGMPVLIGSPAKGGEDGALQGAGRGLLLGVGVGGGLATGGGSYAAAAGILVGAATAIVAAPVGALIGAAQARSKLEVEAAETLLKKVLAETQPSGMVAEYFRAQAVPAVPGTAIVDDARPDARPGGAVRPSADTRVEVSVLRYGLQRTGLGVADPDFQLFIEARARLVRAIDKAELYSHLWRYEGPRIPFFSWADKDGAALRDELRRGSKHLAAHIVHHIFVAPAPSRLEIDVVDARRPPPGFAHDSALPDRR